MTAAAAAPPRIKVMIVDDSAVVREVLSAVIGADPGLRVIATAPDPIAARLKMNADWPDVIVLDVEMPRMDGITFLRHVLISFDLPTKQNVVRSILSRLRPGGVLFVGMAESLNGVVGELQALSPGAYTVRSEASR